MANAFKTIGGGLVKAADAVLLGGAVGKTQRRNAFADMIQQGDYQSAADFATRHGRNDLAQMAAQRGQAQQASVQQKQDDENTIFSGLSIALSEISDPNARRMAFEAMKPGLSQRYGLDEQDFSQVPLDDANALRLFGQQFISPETQAAQLLTRQKQGEDVRSNMAGERLRGGELAVAQQNANTAEFKARAPQTGGMITLPDGTVIQTGPTQGDSARRRVESRGQRVQLIADKFDQAMGQVSPLSAGLAGPTAIVPGTPAKNLAATIDTIRANIGFEELQAMRDASPTGGALGQVTEREIAFLQSVLGSLEQSQGHEQLRGNLGRAKQEVLASWQRVLDAYESDYGQKYEGPGASQSQSRPAIPSNVTEEDIAFTMQKHGLSREEVLRRIGG